MEGLLNLPPAKRPEVLHGIQENLEHNVVVLTQQLRGSISVINSENPVVADALSTLHQLLYAELLRSGGQQSLSSLSTGKRDVPQTSSANKAIQDTRVEETDFSAQREELQKSLVRFHRLEQRTEALIDGIRADVSAFKRELTESVEVSRDELHRLTNTSCNVDSVQRYKDAVYIYSYERNTGELCRTHLGTAKQSTHPIPLYKFKFGCCLNELPGTCLLVTGGGYGGSSEVVRIDLGSFEVSFQAQMRTPRHKHAAVYYAKHLYVLGGMNHDFSNKCERYICADNCWEALPPLPQACCNMTGVVVEDCLYALGGHDGSSLLDLIQMMSIEGLTWELIPMRLPNADCAIPCFQLSETQIYLLLKETLWSFAPLEVKPIKTLLRSIRSLFGPSYFSKGRLYCSYDQGAARVLEVGSLNC
jgi:hypothetical protein